MWLKNESHHSSPFITEVTRDNGRSFVFVHPISLPGLVLCIGITLSECHYSVQSDVLVWESDWLPDGHTGTAKWKICWNSSQKWRIHDSPWTHPSSSLSDNAQRLPQSALEMRFKKVQISNSLKTNVNNIEKLIPTSQRTRWVFIRRINRLMLFREIIIIYSNNHMKHIYEYKL
jgi:hypothetical protein